MKKIVLLSLLSVFAVTTNSGAQTIYTIAGTGVAGFSGDTGVATGAKVYGPSGIAVDGAGNTYFSDYYNQRVRRISSSGNITTVAGNGTAGFTGDNVIGNSTRLNNPMGLAADAYGNVYIADKGNNRIRKIDSSGYITTIAGTGTGGYTGDNGPATDAQLFNPTGVAVDNWGNVYIADKANNAVRKIDAAGMITTIAGNGNQGYNGDTWPSATLANLYAPSGVAVDNMGNVYIADESNNRVRKVDTFNKISTIMGRGIAGFTADGVMATNSEIYQPNSVSVDAYGNVYVSDQLNYMIRKVDHNTNSVVTIAGKHGVSSFNGDTGLAVNALIGNCKGLAVDASGNIAFTDWQNNRVNYITSTIAAVKEVSGTLSGIDLYPSPNKGTFTVNVASATKEMLHVTITNVTGQKVKEITSETNKPIVIDLNAASGIYFVTAASANGSVSGKVQIK